MILSEDNTLNPDQVKAILESSAEHVPAMNGIVPHEEYGYGRLDVANALQYTKRHLRFVNSIEGTENYGALVIDQCTQNAVPVPSGTSYGFPVGGTVHTVRTDELPFIPNWRNTGMSEKFIYWDFTPKEYSLLHPFQSQPSTPGDQIALFQQTYPATIGIHLIDKPSVSDGMFEFRDPWRYYIDGNGCWQQSDVFLQYQGNLDIRNSTINDYGGIFLGQLTNHPPDPYYSVSTDAIQPIPPNGGYYPWYFMEWSGQGAYIEQPASSNTPIRFDAANAVVSANFKAHLISNIASSTSEPVSALSPNSQRKVDMATEQYTITYPNGLYQAVYVSAGDVWFVQSSDGGVNWTPEKRVSAGIGAADHPSIAAGRNGAYIAYIESGISNDRSVKLKRFTDQGNFSEIAISYPFADPDAAPVLELQEDGIENIVFLVWEGLTQKLEYAAFHFDAQQARDAIQNSGTTAKAVRPSMARSGIDYYLCWREDAIVKFTEVFIWLNGNTLNLNFSMPLVDISNFWHQAIQAPSVTLASDLHPAVAWTSYNPSYGRFISFRERLWPDNWGTFATMITGLPNHDFWAPSVAGLTDQVPQEGLRIAHNHTEYIDPLIAIHPITVQRLTGGFWSPCYVGIESLHPTITKFATGSSLRILCPDQAPPGITSGLWYMHTTADCLPAKRKNTTFECAREIALLADTSRATMRLSELEFVDGASSIILDWETGFDTLVVGAGKPVHQYLRSTTFNPTNGSHLKYRVAVERTGSYVFSDSLRLRFQIVDAGSGQVLSTTGNVHPKSLPKGKGDVTYNVGLNSLGGSTIYLRVFLEGMDTTLGLRAIDYYVAPGGSFPKAGDSDREQIQASATEYVLSQNYPNPFAASTEIGYTLRHSGLVRLTVTDLLGRVVAVLVDGERPAGSHTATFEGAGLPAGIYFYRLEIDGKVLTKRMNLQR